MFLVQRVLFCEIASRAYFALLAFSFVFPSPSGRPTHNLRTSSPRSEAVSLDSSPFLFSLSLSLYPLLFLPFPLSLAKNSTNHTCSTNTTDPSPNFSKRGANLALRSSDARDFRTSIVSPTNRICSNSISTRIPTSGARRARRARRARNGTG